MVREGTDLGAGNVATRALAAIVPVAVAGYVGTLATRPNIPAWYDGLAKPAGTPPNLAFPIVWTVLYAGMAWAAFRVLSLPRERPGRQVALGWFFVQLALNAGWTWSFFAARDPALGSVIILVLLVAILVTINRFWTLDRVAALLLVPYALWVGYATYLTLGIWRLNG